MAVLQYFIPETISSHICHMILSLILNGYGDMGRHGHRFSVC